jgi:hypothetical protein
MRSLFVLGAIAATMLATAARAQNYPWCALYKEGAVNCGFTTFQQCLATVSGSGGLCTQNTTYQPRVGHRRGLASIDGMSSGRASVVSTRLRVANRTAYAPASAYCHRYHHPQHPLAIVEGAT